MTAATTSSTYRPDYCTPPGYSLEELLDHIGMTQANLAARLGLTPKTINGIVQGSAPITPRTALGLERVFGTPASFWLAGEAAWQERQARCAEAERFLQAEQALAAFPMRAAAKLGWIQLGATATETLGALLTFLGIASLDQFEAVYGAQAVAYRRSGAYEVSTHALAMWMRQGELTTQRVDCEPYSEARFRASLRELRSLTREPDPQQFLPTLTDVCAQAGVAVALVPELPGTHVSGAAWWPSPRRAAIVLSCRHKSNDHLWFSFFHEAAHLLLHGKRERFVDSPDGAGTDACEREADQFAADALIPRAEYARAFTGRPVSEASVREFADHVGVAPGIVVGRLQHDGLVPFSHLNGLKCRYRWAGSAS